MCANSRPGFENVSLSFLLPQFFNLLVYHLKRAKYGYYEIALLYDLKATGADQGEIFHAKCDIESSDPFCFPSNENC